MPPADDPLARLHGRVAFERAFENEAHHISTNLPTVSGKPIDLYSLFEVVRAAKDIQGLPNGYAFILARDYLSHSFRWDYLSDSYRSASLNTLKLAYEEFCLPFFHRLQSDVEAVYAVKSLTEQTAKHKWFIDRVTVLSDENNSEPQVLLKDRCETFIGYKGTGLEATEEQQFLSLPEYIQGVIRARLKEGSLANEERAHYLFISHEVENVLIDLRSHIIRMWYRNTGKRLQRKTALSLVPVRFQDLGCRIFTYLECAGFINFGAITLETPVALQIKSDGMSPQKIAVIGAGMCGLIAARQLQSFGFSVTVFEAQKRPGGRVFTETELFSAPVDMGAMIITGVIQNPVSVLADQVQSATYTLDTSCPLYNIDGTLVSKKSDSWAEREYNSMLDVTNLYRTNEAFADRAARLSLGQTIERVLSSKVPGRGESGLRTWGIEEKDYVMFSGSRVVPAINSRPSTNPSKQQWAGRSTRSSQVRSQERKRLKVSSEMRRNVGSRSEIPSSNNSCHEHRSSKDEELVTRLLGWHVANLEYACAATIFDLSLVHWDQDDPYGLFGEHVLLKKGYKPLIDGLVEGLEPYLRFGGKVTEIDYSADNGSVKLSFDDEQFHSEDIVYDAVLVTVSLGVLKSGSISFKPPLPAKKQEAINRLGFGGLMKVTMEWSETFWARPDIFGALRESAELRGEFFCFWNLAPCLGRPILVGMVTEPLVAEMEKLPDQEIIGKAVKVLRNIYPKAPDPKAFAISRWTQDECAGGAYTHIPVGSSGADYDILASSVGGSSFFGGEHTCRQYPATCAAAVISGLREANKIAEASERVKKITKFYSEKWTEESGQNPCI